MALSHTNHWQRGGTYGWQAAAAGCAALCWTNTLANLPPWGATTPAVGNNPLVIAVPADPAAPSAAPVVLDMALSHYSYGTLADHRARNEPLPFPGGFDESGALTTDAAAIERTQRALPVGLWKGSGLAFALDVLGALLADGLATHEIPIEPLAETGQSQVFIAFGPQTLASARFRARQCRGSPPRCRTRHTGPTAPLSRRARPRRPCRKSAKRRSGSRRSLAIYAGVGPAGRFGTLLNHPVLKPITRLNIDSTGQLVMR